MHTFIHPLIHLFLIYTSIHPSIKFYQLIIHSSIHLFKYSFIYLAVCVPFLPSIYPSINLLYIQQQRVVKYQVLTLFALSTCETQTCGYKLCFLNHREACPIGYSIGTQICIFGALIPVSNLKYAWVCISNYFFICYW